MTVYQRCPFCHRTYEIGSTGYKPLKKHVRREHTNQKQNTPLLA
jgi:glutaredoxin 2